MSQIADNCPNPLFASRRPIMNEKGPGVFISDEEVLEFKNMALQTYPTDHIRITNSAVDHLLRLSIRCNGYNQRKEEEWFTIPADIVFAYKVPILNCEIELVSDKVTTPPTLYRVSIFPDYINKIEKAGFGDIIFVGFTQCQKEIVAICVKKGGNCLMTVSVVKNKTDDSGARSPGEWGTLNLIWYCIEFALLHPVIKDVFAHPQRTEIQSSHKTHKKGKKGKKHNVKYIKRHVINAEDLENAMREHGGRKINRTTMLWYVSGHWRKYKSGKLVFIQPYWKGPLRNSKKDVPPRNREIVVASDYQDVG